MVGATATSNEKTKLAIAKEQQYVANSQYHILPSASLPADVDVLCYDQSEDFLVLQTRLLLNPDSRPSATIHCTQRNI